MTQKGLGDFKKSENEKEGSGKCCDKQKMIKWEKNGKTVKKCFYCGEIQPC